MNVGNSRTEQYYTPYRTNQNPGYFKGFKQTEKGLVVTEQRNSTEKGFIGKFVDYKEFHKEWMSQPNTDYYFGHAYDVSGVKKTAAEAMKTATASENRKTVENDFYKITKGKNGMIEVYDKATGIFYRFDEEYLSVQTEEKTGAQFLISDIPDTTMNVEAMKLTPQLKAAMEQYLNGEKVVEKTLDAKFTLYRDSATGIESLHWRSGDGFASRMMISTKEQLQRYNELVNTYLSNYPNLVSGYEEAEIKAAREIEGYARRTPGGIISISSNAIRYVDNKDYGTKPPDFSHCWSYTFDEKMHQDGYEDFIFGLREHMLSAPLGNLENKEAFLNGFLDYTQAVRAKIEELYEKIKNGDTEQKFSIGAEEYTIKEWDELLAKFDEAEEEIRKAQAEEIEKRMEKLQQEAERKKAEKETELSMAETEFLTAQTTQCSYPPEKPEGETVRYIICYTEKGIFCSEAGKTEGYVWSYSFKNKEEYEKVMDFLDKLPLDWNLRFTAHENFWKDFLNGKIDETEFLDFLDGTNKGVPDYTLAKGDSVYVDTDKIKWAPYFNPLGSQFYTAEEFQKRQREIIEENAAKLPKLKGSFEEKKQ